MNISKLNKQHKLAKRYAVALFKLKEDYIEKEIKEIINTLDENPNLKDFLNNKIIKTEDKKEVFEKIFTDLGEKTRNFCLTLLDNKKMDHIDSIYAELAKLTNTQRNLQEAIVVSAVELNHSEIARIKGKLEDKFKKEFNLTNIINEEILSGLMIKIEDTLIDLSLKTKLNTLRKQII